MPSGIRRARRWAIAAAIGVVLALAAAPLILCENALHMPAWARHETPPALADAVAHEAGAAWQAAEIDAADGAVLRAWCFTPLRPSGDAVILLHGVADTRQGVL